MCYIITLAVARTRAASLADSAAARELNVELTSNPSLNAALPKGYAGADLVSGWCSCGLYAGKRRRSHADALRKKYAKKGWSEAKISRAIEQSTASGDRFEGLHSDVVRVLADAAALGPVGVLVHWYDGDAATEAISVTGTSRTAVSRLAEAAAELAEDAWLWVDP